MRFVLAVAAAACLFGSGEARAEEYVVLESGATLHALEGDASWTLPSRPLMTARFIRQEGEWVIIETVPKPSFALQTCQVSLRLRGIEMRFRVATDDLQLVTTKAVRSAPNNDGTWTELAAGMPLARSDNDVIEFLYNSYALVGGMSRLRLYDPQPIGTRFRPDPIASDERVGWRIADHAILLQEEKIFRGRDRGWPLGFEPSSCAGGRCIDIERRGCVRMRMLVPDAKLVEKVQRKPLPKVAGEPAIISMLTGEGPLQLDRSEKPRETLRVRRGARVFDRDGHQIGRARAARTELPEASFSTKRLSCHVVSMAPLDPKGSGPELCFRRRDLVRP